MRHFNHILSFLKTQNPSLPPSHRIHHIPLHQLLHQHIRQRLEILHEPRIRLLLPFLLHQQTEEQGIFTAYPRHTCRLLRGGDQDLQKRHNLNEFTVFSLWIEVVGYPWRSIGCETRARSRANAIIIIKRFFGERCVIKIKRRRGGDTLVLVVIDSMVERWNSSKI